MLNTELPVLHFVPVRLLLGAELGGSGNGTERVSFRQIEGADSRLRTGLRLIVAECLAQQLVVGALLRRQFVVKQKVFFPVF